MISFPIPRDAIKLPLSKVKVAPSTPIQVSPIPTPGYLYNVPFWPVDNSTNSNGTPEELYLR